MTIGDFDLSGNRTFIIAELSANHNGSLDMAIETIKAAKRAGADAIKLQTYRADTITLKSDRPEFTISGGTLWDGKTLYELYDEAHTPWEWHEQLFKTAHDEGLLCFSSPFDNSAVDFLAQFDPPAYKIASFEITDHALIRHCARQHKPMIISTGIATFDEIHEAVSICRNEGNNDIVLLKCTSAYPAPLDQANLRTITDMAQTFGTAVGFSDHTLGITAPIAAVTLGAKVIEKHFILDKAIGGPDADFSLDLEEFSAMVKAVRETEQLLGKVTYEMDEKRLKSRHYSRSLYVSQEIKAGEIFTEANVKSVRPGLGLHPRHLDALMGRPAKRDYEAGEPLDEDALH
jgi:pseudaminic acid synthase